MHQARSSGSGVMGDVIRSLQTWTAHSFSSADPTLDLKLRSRHRQHLVLSTASKALPSQFHMVASWGLLTENPANAVCLTLVSFWNFGACVPCPVTLSLLRVFEDSITWTVLTNPSTGSNWSPAPAALTASEYPEGWTWENTFLGHWFLSKKQSLSKRKESPFCGLDMEWVLRMLTCRRLGPWLVVPLGKW